MDCMFPSNLHSWVPSHGGGTSSTAYARPSRERRWRRRHRYSLQLESLATWISSERRCPAKWQNEIGIAKVPKIWDEEWYQKWAGSADICGTHGPFHANPIRIPCVEHQGTVPRGGKSGLFVFPWSNVATILAMGFSVLSIQTSNEIPLASIKLDSISIMIYHVSRIDSHWPSYTDIVDIVYINTYNVGYRLVLGTSIVKSCSKIIQSYTFFCGALLWVNMFEVFFLFQWFFSFPLLQL